MDLELRTLPVASLVPAPYNPRRPLSSTAKKKLAASLDAFGLVEPLVWNELSGHVVGGHARLALLKERGVAEVPVSVVRLTPERERALNVILNNPAAQGRYDPAKLAELLEGMEGLPEMDLAGFTPADLRALRFEPLDEMDAEEPGDRVEVVIETDAATYARCATDLDELIRRYDLVSHTRAS